MKLANHGWRNRGGPAGGPAVAGAAGGWALGLQPSAAPASAGWGSGAPPAPAVCFLFRSILPWFSPVRGYRILSCILHSCVFSVIAYPVLFIAICLSLRDVSCLFAVIRDLFHNISLGIPSGWELAGGSPGLCSFLSSLVSTGKLLLLLLLVVNFLQIRIPLLVTCTLVLDTTLPAGAPACPAGEWGSVPSVP